MLSLLLDSSNVNLCVGISKDNELVYKTSYPCFQRQSEEMIPEIKKALDTLNLELLDFDEVVYGKGTGSYTGRRITMTIGKGPGSYTGLRISMTIAKIICQLSNAKLKLVSSLRIMGNSNKKFIALMNARSNRSYIGVYNFDKVELEDQIMTNDQVREYINKHPDYELIGDLGYLQVDAIPADEVNGLLSFKDLVEEENDVLKVKPIYLKENYGI